MTWLRHLLPFATDHGSGMVGRRGIVNTTKWGADMRRFGMFIALVALSAVGSAAAEKANVTPQCTKQPGMIGDPMVGTADTARSIYLSVAKQRGDKVSPENDIIVEDDGGRWAVFQYPKHIPAPKRTATGEEEVTVVAGGGALEMEIDKCTGAIRAHYSR
jgi:hypothetical protein